MAARFDSVLTTRVPAEVERALKARAREDDRSLSQFVRRLLIEAAQPKPAGGDVPATK
jgi:predicted HicB family RNase H-like nuclease